MDHDTEDWTGMDITNNRLYELYQLSCVDSGELPNPKGYLAWIEREYGDVSPDSRIV
jgi:hypothetical protein